MKTAGVGPILSIMCVGIASACSSKVSIGHNDNSVTSDSGNGQPLGAGGQGTDDGGSTTSVAGQLGTGGIGAGGAPQYGSGGAAWVGGPSFEAEPGAWLAEDAGSARCEPLDATGSTSHTVGWEGVPPGGGVDGCGANLLESASDIAAVHSVNAPGVASSWVGLRASHVDSCDPPPPDTFLYTADVLEQITWFDAPIHANAGDFVFIGHHMINTTNQPSSGEATVFLLPTTPPSQVPCALHGAFAGMERGWELDPGQELMECMRLTLNHPHEPFIVRVKNTSEGTESVLSFGGPTGPGGDSVCDETADAATKLAIVKGAATVEAKPRDAHMLAGQQLVLRVRAANAANVRRTGTVSVKLY